MDIFTVKKWLSPIRRFRYAWQKRCPECGKWNAAQRDDTYQDQDENIEAGPSSDYRYWLQVKKRRYRCSYCHHTWFLTVTKKSRWY